MLIILFFGVEFSEKKRFFQLEFSNRVNSLTAWFIKNCIFSSFVTITNNDFIWLEKFDNCAAF